MELKKIKLHIASYIYDRLYDIKNFYLQLKAILFNNIKGMTTYEGHSLKQKIEESLDLFLTEEQKKDKLYINKISRDITLCAIRYKTTPFDYFLLGFNTINTNKESRKKFVTDKFKDDLLIKYDGWENYLELNDKFGLYEKISSFYKRELFKFTSKTNRQDFINFACRINDLFIKPNSSSYGNGAMVKYIKTAQEANCLYDFLIKNGDDWLIEERIIQHDSMAAWNKSSVNTIRYITCLNKNGLFTLTPILRTGRKGSIIDNTGGGGIFANIDLVTGKIYTNGIDKLGNVYTEHPDSNIKFLDWKVPQWEELKMLAENIHLNYMSHHIYIGWDFAFSEKGWCLIEGNWAQFGSQMVDKKGRKEEFISYIKPGKV